MTQPANFTASATPAETDLIVGFIAAGGAGSERKTTIAQLRDTLMAKAGATKRVIANNLRFVPPQATAATIGAVTGPSTPAETYQTWDFDSAAIEYLDIYGVMNGTLPASTGCTLKFQTISAATSGNYIFDAAFRRLTGGDIDTGAFTFTTNAQAATVATSGTAGTPTLVSIGFTTGTQMNSVVAGDYFMVRLWRDATNGSDTVNSNDIRVLEHSIYIEEA